MICLNSFIFLLPSTRFPLMTKVGVDLTLKSLIKAKHRFMSNKYEGILNYNKVQKELKGQIKLELTKP